MIKRFATAFVLMPLAIWGAVTGGWALISLVAIVAALCFYELSTMATLPRRYLFIGVGLIGIWVASTGVTPEFWLSAWPLLGLVGLGCVMSAELLLGRLLLPADFMVRFMRFCVTFGLPFSYIVLMRDLPNGLFWVFLCFVCTWASDSAALFGGKWLGRTKLAPTISPNKTWEGAGFGVLGAIAASVALSSLMLPTLDLMVIGIGATIAITGQLGDLHESLTKRFFGVKDSSQLLPGHGGVYDRLDSLLVVIPIVYLLARYV